MTTPNAFQWLYEALKTINDNLVTMSANLAETHERMGKIEDMLTITAEPFASTSATENEEAANIHNPIIY